MKTFRALAAALLPLGAVAAVPAAADDAALWRLLASGGHAAVMRHATAPGVGDPPNFTLGDCATQRNLSEQGRAEARAVGARFRQAGVAVAKVVTSQWCRARDTAAGLSVGPVVEDARLNSFFQAADRPLAIAATRAAVAEAPREGPIAVFVTHQVNVTALTEVYPTSGEIVVVRLGTDGSLAPVGSIKP